MIPSLSYELKLTITEGNRTGHKPTISPSPRYNTHDPSRRGVYAPTVNANSSEHNPSLCAHKTNSFDGSCDGLATPIRRQSFYNEIEIGLESDRLGSFTKLKITSIPKELGSVNKTSSQKSLSVRNARSESTDNTASTSVCAKIPCIPVQAAPKKLVQFMELATEIRMNIWDKLFEDEAYIFKAEPGCDSGTVVAAHKPQSWGALLINKECYKEVRKQIYKSMRLELDFGSMKPLAISNVLPRLGNHPLGQQCERIFFVKKFGIHQVNLDLFTNAKEIVSAHWTIQGDMAMDEADFTLDLIDSNFILKLRLQDPI